jgi:hypothetical protein
MDEWVLKTHGFWWGIFEKPPNLMLLLLLQFCGSIRTGIARWSSFHVLGLRVINQKLHGSLTVGGCILSPEFYMVVGHMYRRPLPLKINRLKPPTKYRGLSKGGTPKITIWSAEKKLIWKAARCNRLCHIQSMLGDARCPPRLSSAKSSLHKCKHMKLSNWNYQTIELQDRSSCLEFYKLSQCKHWGLLCIPLLNIPQKLGLSHLEMG